MWFSSQKFQALFTKHELVSPSGRYKTHSVGVRRNLHNPFHFRNIRPSVPLSVYPSVFIKELGSEWTDFELASFRDVH